MMMTDDREREKRIRYGFLIWIEEKNAEKIGDEEKKKECLE